MNEKERKEIVAFYNVENLFPPDPVPVHRLDPTLSGLRNWDDRKYRNKLFKISHAFQLIQEAEGVLPMLIGLSEIEGKKPLEDLLALDPLRQNYDFIHYDSLDERGVDVALLYDKTKIEIISSEPISYFFEIPDDNPANYDTTRDILFCKVKFQEQIINVFVLHLPSKREKDINKPKRDFILKDLKEKLSAPELKNQSVIILGDFNENPDNENIVNLLYHDITERKMQNPFQNLFKNQIFSTFHIKNGLLFDQIILSEEFFDANFPIKFKMAKVFNPEKLSTWNKKLSGRPFRTYSGNRYFGGYSDHFPVLVEFDVKK